MVEVNGKPILYRPWTFISICHPERSRMIRGANHPAKSRDLLLTKLGKIGRLNTGGSYIYAAIPTAAGRLDYITTSTYARVEHPDWLGSSRFMSNPHLNTAIGAVAYAPFGESYNKSSAMRLNFTDQFQDSQIPDTYDFEARKLSDIQGRWLSPDPAGLTAVDMTNPQTWNRYAYVGNTPLTATDPSGLFIAICQAGRGGDLVCFDNAQDGTAGMGFEHAIPVGGGGGFGFGINFLGSGGQLGCGSDFLPCGLSAGGASGVPCDFGVCGPSIGNPYTDPAPTQGGLQGAEYTFHTYVLWPFLDPAATWEMDSRGLFHSGLLDWLGIRHYYFYNTTTGEAVGLGPKGWETEESQGRTELVFSSDQSRCMDSKLRNRGGAPEYFWLQGKENVFPRPTALNCFGYCMRVAHSCEYP